MDQVHVIRHKVLVERLGVRCVAREMGVSRNTVRRYLTLAEPVRRESRPRGRPVWAAVGPRLEALLSESPRWTGGKQRLTATRLHDLLRGEGYEVGVTVVRQAVAEWKRRRREVFVPLVYAPGELAEVDFFEVLVDIAGVRRKAWLFVLRLMYSGRDFAWLYDRQDQVSFLDGHVRAFAHLGAVPQRIAYDNLKPAVRRILAGSGERELTARFHALVSHYLFEPSFCRPGTGHDKGGVEARGKGIRWQHLVPIPSGDEELGTVSTTVLARIDARLDGGRDSEGRTIAERFAAERGQMLALPERPFRAQRSQIATVSRRSLVKIEGVVYSVPCTWASLEVTAHVGPFEVEIVGPRATVTHQRKRFGERSIDYRHYLRELAHKPQAVRQVAAELISDLGEPFASAWRALVDTHGPAQAARIFARVLGYVETRGAQAVSDVIVLALSSGTPLLLALAPPSTQRSAVTSEALPPSLRDIEVACGSAADYDAWLGGGA